MTPTRWFAAAATMTAFSCGAPSDPDADRRAAQLAAATRIGQDIARNPGPLEVLCVAYSGDWEDPPLPEGVGALSFAYAEGCEDVDGQLFAQAGSARAIWVGVGEPDDLGPSGGRVPVFTTTGLDDAASYVCEVTKTDAAWVAAPCRAGPVG